MTTTVSAGRMIAMVCTAQVLAQIGTYTLAALLPVIMQAWSLSNSEAGWIMSMFYAGYTVSVPVLVSLTDRIDPRRVYCCGVAMLVCSHLVFALVADQFWWAIACRTAAGIGWAGTYMPGLKILSDALEGRPQSRGVSWHAASVGVSGALSFFVSGVLATWIGWRWAFGFGAMCAGGALLIGLLGIPKRPAGKTAAPSQRALLDFRPVFRNRSAMAYALSYAVHTWEMNALRGWAVTFLTFTALSYKGQATLIAPTTVATVMGLLGTWSSVFGNEMSIRFGRQRLILTAMVGCIIVGSVIGFSSAISYYLAAGLVILYGLLIWLDSSSLTAGTVGSAEPEHRGATLAVHSTLGFGGGFVGPLMMGWILDLAGGQSALGWGLAYAHVAVIMLIGVFAITVLRPKAIAGDQGAAEASQPSGA
ncbi:MFS transporter [Candidatus Entotheonella palauensis]|uniref:MFS transporter n=1 Tax=Candidatus Entotheonella palauensis TaxID=93172 RepID=UPI0004B2EFBB|nr:MFS transporter [Candidatus Entotheonella palauensis]